MKIKFEKVGRNNASWEAECNTDDVNEIEYDWLYSQVKKHALVMSTNLEFFINEEDMTSGIITAGFHEIGKFKLIKEGETE